MDIGTRNKTNMERILFIILWLTAPTTLALGSEKECQIADSTQAIVASIVLSTPTDVLYSSFGHCALRMQYPSENLDYCFSLEMGTGALDYYEFLSGKAKAAVVAVPTKEYLDSYKSEGRGVTEHILNLTHTEKQLLWQNLDEEMVKPPHLTFNLLNTNCVMMCYLMVKNSLINEQMEFGQLPEVLSHDNGDIIRYNSQDSPWGEFIFMSIFGASSDKHFDIEYKLSPKMLVEVLDSTRFVAENGTSRPAFTGEVITHNAATVIPKPSWMSPTIFFTILLIIVIIVTLLEWKCNLSAPAKIIDVILLSGQTIFGIILLYMSISANLFGMHWNWYLIPFNPLPLIIWLFFRKSKSMKTVYLAYSIILLAFVMATPYLSQLDMPHQLITTSFLIRCLSHYVKIKKLGCKA